MLTKLVGKTLDLINPEREMIQRLLEAANGSIENAKLSGMNEEGQFDMAYKAIMQLANAALQANGYRTRTSQPGHHQLMIQALRTTIALDPETTFLLDRLRRQRNLNDYCGDRVSKSMAKEALRHAIELKAKVEGWLVLNKPDLIKK
jgi:HEPN domain-containing protein